VVSFLRAGAYPVGEMAKSQASRKRSFAANVQEAFRAAIVITTVLAVPAIAEATQAQDHACDGMSLSDEIKILETELGDQIGRFIVTVKTATTDSRATIDQVTSEIATLLLSHGALIARPISGQPLLVVELPGSMLPHLLDYKQITCVQSDVPQMPGR
jgi:hypothetical protein